ncbi:porin PorA family protein [Nocardioides sp. TF02-7]|uniref:porin PorA family protein n=1 Tax=Nocardioides sp. TF02-7 TaxID=2917724 RepID=UPI001F05D4DC|nr:porin PorA family protein [Nocardioides sp. TF02-7]UMG92151.1 porin PorA family protein [Nocardioides sp. TF02-7]
MAGRSALAPLAGRRVVVVNWRDLDHSLAGGSEIYAWHLARALAEGGADVELVTAREPGQARSEHRDGIAVHRHGGPLGFYPLTAVRLLRRRRRIDAVVDPSCGLPSFAPLVVRRRTPVVLVLHHVHQDQFGAHFPAPVAAFGRWLERVLMPLVYRRRRVVAVSESTRQEMRRRLGWTGPVGLLENGADLPPAGAVDPGRKDPERVVVLGRLVAHKRVDLVLRAVYALTLQLPGVRVDLVGRGPERERLERLAAHLGLTDRVTFHGFVDEERKAQLLARASVHVCASDAEGWGQAVVEAAAYGVPTVARDVPGAARLGPARRDRVAGPRHPGRSRGGAPPADRRDRARPRGGRRPRRPQRPGRGLPRLGGQARLGADAPAGARPGRGRARGPRTGAVPSPPSARPARDRHGRNNMRRLIGPILVGLGVFLIVAAVLVRFYAYPTLARVPDGYNSETNLEAAGAQIFNSDPEVLAPETHDLVITSKTSEDAEADAPDDVTVWVNVVTTDRADGSNFQRSTERAAFDVVTGEGVDCEPCDTWIERVEGEDVVRDPTVFEGQVYKFPFGTEKEDHDVWDGSVGEAVTATYEGEEEIQGLTVYKFVQQVEPTVIETREVPGSVFGASEPVVQAEMVYEMTRTFYVEPQTGSPIHRVEERNQELVHDDVRVPAFVGTVQYTDEQVDSNVDEYDTKAMLLSGSKVLYPLLLVVLGLVLIGLGLVINRRVEGEEAGTGEHDRPLATV